MKKEIDWLNLLDIISWWVLFILVITFSVGIEKGWWCK
jgi:hypothetical protein